MKHACMIAYANYYTDARIKNYVAALVKQGYLVDIFALGIIDSNEDCRVKVFSLMEKHWGNNAIIYAIFQIIFALYAALLVSLSFLKKRYSIVHVHNMPNFLVFSALLPKLGGAKIILDVHDTMPEHYATKFGCNLHHPLVKILKIEERMSAWFADFVITASDLQKEVLCSHGIRSDKVDIILNVGNSDIFRPVQKNFSTEQLTLVYHGTIAERLGIDNIVMALKLASKDCPALRLLLIGEGDFMDEIRKLIFTLKISDKVQMMGSVPVEDLPRYLSKADIGIIGNRAYIEAKQNYMLPVKMLEYAAMEIPTIAPSLLAISHYFNEETALFYRPDDIKDMAVRIRQIYKDREIIDRAKHSLRLFNSIHNWNNMEKKYMHIVSCLMNMSSKKPIKAIAKR